MVRIVFLFVDHYVSKGFPSARVARERIEIAMRSHGGWLFCDDGTGINLRNVLMTQVAPADGGQPRGLMPLGIPAGDDGDGADGEGRGL